MLGLIDVDVEDVAPQFAEGEIVPTDSDTHGADAGDERALVAALEHATRQAYEQYHAAWLAAQGIDAALPPPQSQSSQSQQA